MSGNDDSAAIEPVRDDPRRDGNSGISTAPASGMLSDITADPLAEWGQRAMQVSKEMHCNEDFRLDIARGLF